MLTPSLLRHCPLALLNIKLPDVNARGIIALCQLGIYLHYTCAQTQLGEKVYMRIVFPFFVFFFVRMVNVDVF